MASILDLIDEVQQENMIDQNDWWVPETVSYGESGLDPSRVGDNGASKGLYQLHERGLGAGMGDSRLDPRVNAQKVMPLMAQAIREGKARGLQGQDLLKYVWYNVERPARTAAVEANMESAYNNFGARRSGQRPTSLPQTGGPLDELGAGKKRRTGFDTVLPDLINTYGKAVAAQSKRAKDLRNSGLGKIVGGAENWISKQRQESPGQLYQSGATPVTPPIAELLTEMRNRRQANRDSSKDVLTALLTGVPKMAPQGAKYFPGFEHGGLADTMMGIITGKGAQHGALPEEVRAPGVVPVDLQGLLSKIGAEEPQIDSDMGLASGLAEQIMKRILQIPHYNQYSQQSSGIDLSSILGDITQ